MCGGVERWGRERERERYIGDGCGGVCGGGREDRCGGFYFVLGNPPDGLPAGAPKNPKTHPKSAQIDPGPVPTPPKSMFAHLFPGASSKKAFI